MLVKRELIMARVETVYGTPAIPSPATDAILVENVSFGHDKLRMNERNPVKRSLAPLQEVYGGRLITLSFDVEVKGSGTLGTPPEVGVLLRGCGLDETINAGTDVRYGPVSEGHESLTIYYYEDGILNSIAGAVGTFSLNLEAGTHGKFSFTFTGHQVQRTDDALPNPTYDSTVPAPYINSAFNIGGYAAAISSLSLEMGNNIAAVPSVSAPDGYGQIRISDRAVTGSMDPEAVLKATNDFFEDWEAGNVLNLSSGIIGSVPGNRFALYANVFYKEIGHGDREGIRTYDIGFGCLENIGDDEFSLTFL